MDFVSFIIVGTDTGVGKTLIAAWLLNHFGYDYWKPVQSGCEPSGNLPQSLKSEGNTDSHFIKALLPQSASTHIYPSVYALKAPLSPHLAAEQEGVLINTAKLTLPSHTNLIIEGAGGVMVPLTNSTLLIDWIASLSLPVLVVARDHLGTINHTCLTLEALGVRNIPILGVILNATPCCMPNPRHMDAIETFGRAPVLFTMPTLSPLSTDALASVIPSPSLRKALMSAPSLS